ncbi:hypothetical protein E3N88_41513 [Mikania micrantha]|uniref:Uncharacterized protein n=1 Tax=Mikania micrantha TaxID=192012 RepID=A0A5N6LKG7_9ASTR|nr:hypothetical protein E3N88_41513 [Mikania micrantha]
MTRRTSTPMRRYEMTMKADWWRWKLRWWDLVGRKTKEEEDDGACGQIPNILMRSKFRGISHDPRSYLEPSLQRRIGSFLPKQSSALQCSSCYDGNRPSSAEWLVEEQPMVCYDDEVDTKQ